MSCWKIYHVWSDAIGFKLFENFIVSIERVREKGIPKGDLVAEKRFKKAAANIISIIRNLQGSRLSSLPEGHMDYGLTLEQMIKESKRRNKK